MPQANVGILGTGNGEKFLDAWLHSFLEILFLVLILICTTALFCSRKNTSRKCLCVEVFEKLNDPYLFQLHGLFDFKFYN